MVLTGAGKGEKRMVASRWRRSGARRRAIEEEQKGKRAAVGEKGIDTGGESDVVPGVTSVYAGAVPMPAVPTARPGGDATL